MQTVRVTIPKLHAGQLRIKAERKRRNVLCCGRRFGKNVLLQDLAIETALSARQPIGWGAPVYKQTQDDYRTLSNILAPVIKRQSISEMRLELVSGGTIEFWSLDKPDSIRGKKYARFIVNEAGFVADLLNIRNFIIVPTLIDMRGDEYHAGTPKGMNGFFSLFGQDGPEWARWQMPSYANPHVPVSELDSLKDVMTERAFQQEIMAQFLEDGGGVFRRVQNAATAEPLEYGIKERYYVIGVDWGRSEDATVFVVMDADSREMVCVDRMTDTDYASQRGRLLALSERFNNAPILAEANSIGQPNIEALQMMGAPVTGFTTTNASKAQAIQALELAFERDEIKIINDPILVNELMAYQSERLPSGLVRYGAPEGLHDDTVIATALAWQHMSGNNWLML
jgi:hypothetical protein